MKMIRIGAQEDGMYEILEGLAQLEGRKVVVQNAYSLLGALKNKTEE
jgi:multidrug efflux pump subunit AcrA (membrane-fusion protein)